MANAKKRIMQKDAEEIFAEVNGLSNKEKFAILKKHMYISDAKKEIKKAIEEKNK